MKIISLLLGIAAIIIGFVCFFIPGLDFMMMGWFLGLMLILSGIDSVVGYFFLNKNRIMLGSMITGILALILGVLFIVNQGVWFMSDLAMIYLFALWLLVVGIVNMVLATQIHHRMKNNHWWGWILAFGIAEAVLAIAAMFYPFLTILSMSWLISLFIIAIGLDLIGFGVMSSKDLAKMTK